MAPAASTLRRRRRARTALVTILIVVPLLVIGGITALVGVAVNAFGGCERPDALFSRYDADQLANAATIVAAGQDLGLSTRDQTIAVMTAMGESSLRNLDHGDWETSGVTSPDGTPTTSLGLFQQQEGWGTRDERLDPYTAATLFYRALIAEVPDRDALEPTIVAHRVQVNRDAEHYARYWSAAQRVVAQIDDPEADAGGC